MTVRTRVSGVNTIDLGVRAGGVLPDEPERCQMVLGCDGRGLVEAPGATVRDLKVGVRVMVLSKQPSSGIGTHQDIVVRPKAQVAELVDGVSFEGAAAVLLVTITALNSVEALGLDRWQTIHVNDLDGAVGRAAVQIARTLGFTVVDDPEPSSVDGSIDVPGGDQDARRRFALH